MHITPNLLKKAKIIKKVDISLTYVNFFYYICKRNPVVNPILILSLNTIINTQLELKKHKKLYNLN